MSNQPTSLPEEDIEFVMDTFQRSMGKSKPVRDTQLEGEKPQSKESANSTETPVMKNSINYAHDILVQLFRMIFEGWGTL
ncbi:hypothetical protein ACEOB8_20335 [Escherichia coli]|uniref:hypothetical protein n=1 Tax=Escherichia coli TaxID=562 RepID=UPI000AB97936